MRDYQEELSKRVDFIKNLLKTSGTTGIVYGNSGGKDSALVGIICKKACDNTVGITMPCSKRNYGEDIKDGLEVAEKYGIKTLNVEIAPMKEVVEKNVSAITKIGDLASANIAPRLRMTTLYAYAGSNNMLVAGTGNRTETYIGYFTKWGDGACDFNPISDLTVKEVYEFLKYLDCPECIINKAPSAALYNGQTDEQEIGMKYSDIDEYILTGKADKTVKEKVDGMHRKTEHKRQGVAFYKKV